MSADKIATCIIAGDSWNPEEVKKMLTSLEGNVATIFVNYNGKKKTLPWQKWTTTPIIYKKHKWEDDFALARNQSFDMVPREDYGWYFWCDVDDIVIFEESLDEFFSSLDEYTTGVFLKYDYAIEPKTGIVVVEQWRERFLSTKIQWKWFYKIHEVCKAASAVQYAKRTGVYVRHQRTNGEDRGARERNRRIISKALIDNPGEIRYKFYLAAETMAEADSEKDPLVKLQLIDAAILAYNKYRESVTDISEDIYLATTRIAELQRMKRDYSAALEADLEAIAIYPDWPDGYVGGAKTCLEIRDFSRMKAFADMATKCVKPDTSASIEPMMVGFTPIFLRGIANEELGFIEQAADDYEEALKIWQPPDVHIIQDKIKEFRSHDYEKDAQEDERKKYRSTKPDKSICFFTQPIPEAWHPKTLKESGSGGAELCIMNLAPMFKADGWRVVIFGTPGENRGVYEGVEYWNTEEFVSQEKFKVLVSSRSTLPFQEKPNADASFLWNHDVNLGPDAAPFMSVPDKVIGLTEWHSKHLQKLYNIPENKMTIIPNGVSLDRFPLKKWNHDQNKLIYSSSPDRGLDQLLGIWKYIKSRYPDLELHIYYGWHMIDKIIEHYKEMGVNQQSDYLKQFKTKIMHQIDFLGGEEAGIYQHGRVNQDVLAEAMMGSNIWPYPTTFAETFAITAIEMQAAGVIPVTSNLAALTETVAPYYEKLDGWPANNDYQSRFLRLFAMSYEDEEYRQEGRELGRKHAESYSWQNAYKIWNDNIKEVTG